MDDSEAEGQRRIELDSDKDLAYLIANVRAAAAEHLHAAFPQSGGEDELRNEIEAIVDDVRIPIPFPHAPSPSVPSRRISHYYEPCSQNAANQLQYIDKTFTLAVPNLSINGLPAKATDFFPPKSSKGGRKSSIPPLPDDTVAYEPFDAHKRQRVADLVTEEERLLEEVAAMKRAVPADVAAKVAAQMEAAAARDEAQLQEKLDSLAAAKNTATSASTGGVGGAGLAVLEPLERQDGVEERFRAAVAALGRLQRDMPTVVAKMERARVAGEYVRDGR